MKIPNPYFENVPKYGNLVVEQVIVEYVYPLLSVLKDSSGNRYLCMCFDTRGSQQWLISPISASNLIKMLMNRLTLKEAFVKDTGTVIYAYRNYETREDSFEQMASDKVPTEYLPEAGEYLDAEPNEWEEYIEKINASICDWIESWAAEPIYSNKVENRDARILVNMTKQYSLLKKQNKPYAVKALIAQCIPCGVY